MIFRSSTRVLLAACGLALFQSSPHAQETPNIVNPDTGSVVELTRAYWDANTDIANRTIQCDFFRYNPVSAAFEIEPESGQPPFTSRERTASYFHSPLPDIEPRMNYARVGDDPRFSVFNNIPLWSVVDGVYSGLAPLAESEYVEIVAYQSSENNAVRVWYDDVQTANYHVCYATDGQAFLPGGAPGVNTCLLYTSPSPRDRG